MTDDNGWDQYKREILYRLDELKEEVGQVRSTQTEIQREQQKQGRALVALKVKSSIWGGLSGAIIVGAEYVRRILTGGV